MQILKCSQTYRSSIWPHPPGQMIQASDIPSLTILLSSCDSPLSITTPLGCLQMWLGLLLVSEALPVSLTGMQLTGRMLVLHVSLVLPQPVAFSTVVGNQNLKIRDLNSSTSQGFCICICKTREVQRCTSEDGLSLGNWEPDMWKVWEQWVRGEWTGNLCGTGEIRRRFRRWHSLSWVHKVQKL